MTCKNNPKYLNCDFSSSSEDESYNDEPKVKSKLQEAKPLQPIKKVKALSKEEISAILLSLSKAEEKHIQKEDEKRHKKKKLKNPNEYRTCCCGFKFLNQEEKDHFRKLNPDNFDIQYKLLNELHNKHHSPFYKYRMGNIEDSSYFNRESIANDFVDFDNFFTDKNLLDKVL